MNKTLRRKQQFINDNSIETFRNLTRTVGDSFVKDLVKEGGLDAKDQVLKTSHTEQKIHPELSGDLVEGKELVLKEHIENEEKNEFFGIEGGEIGTTYLREMRHGESTTQLEFNKETKRTLEEIQIELQQLIESTDELQIQFREVTVQQQVVKPGRYHVNFFQWLKSVIIIARMKIEDSGAWLSAFQSKKNKRQYWAMFKKNGTTFGLSNERVVATQTG